MMMICASHLSFFVITLYYSFLFNVLLIQVLKKSIQVLNKFTVPFPAKVNNISFALL